MKETKILVVEDDNDINNLICSALSHANSNYKTFSAYSGSEAVLMSQYNEFDLILLDLMLPGIPGEEVLNQIRENKNMPVIIISAKTDKLTKVSLLDIGADDFISKPFDIDEMTSRVNAVLRRYNKHDISKINELVFKDLKIIADSRETYLNDKQINLTATEFDILKLLMENPKKVFSRANIYETLWNENFFGDESTVNVHVSNIRAKLNTKDDYIKTVWGIGFKLSD